MRRTSARRVLVVQLLAALCLAAGCPRGGAADLADERARMVRDQIESRGVRDPAVLAEIAGEVRSIEIVPALARRARATLDALGYDRVQTRTGDGYAGWPEAAPFDVIVVTAAPDHVPQPLVDQLAPRGRLVIPVGRGVQSLAVLTRTADGVTREEVAPVRFVPMTGTAEQGPPR